MVCVGAGGEGVRRRRRGVRDHWLRGGMVRAGYFAGFAADGGEFRPGDGHGWKRRNFDGCGDRSGYGLRSCRRCGRLGVRVRFAVNVDDEAVRIGEEEGGVLLEVVDVENNAGEVG